MNPIVLNAGGKPMKNHAKTSQVHGLIESMELCWRLQAKYFVQRSLFKGPAKLLIRNARFSPELCRTIPLPGAHWKVPKRGLDQGMTSVMP
jgi:hypothetical protein